MPVNNLLQSIMVGGSADEEKVLRSPTQELHSLDDLCLKTITDLRDTIKQYPFCVGLSAPQIGCSLAISVIDINHAGAGNDIVMINPHIIELKGKKDKKRESCMSVWGKQGEVERRDKVVVEYRNENFQLVTDEYRGYVSRCIQHEIDHLNGVLYVDKLVPGSSLSDASFFDDYSSSKEVQ